MADFILNIAGASINFDSSSFFNLNQLDVSYEGKQLSFSEIATPQPYRNSFAFNDYVTLIMSRSYGTYTLFSGRIRERRHQGVNHGEAIEYTAIGLQNVAYDLQLTYNGFPAVSYPMVFWTSSVSYGSFTLNVRVGALSAVIPDFFSLMANDLATNSITASFGTPGPDTLIGYIGNDLEFTNVTFGEAIKRIMEWEPNRRCFYDDYQGAWTFPDIVNAPIRTVEISTGNVLENVYQANANNRYTAVELWAYYDYPFAAKNTQVCSNAWNTELELDWTLSKAQGVQNPEDFNPDYQWVYRRWSIPEDANKGFQFTPARAYALIPFWNTLKYVPLNAYIDWDTNVIVTQWPVVIAGNPHALDPVKLEGGGVSYESSAVGPLAVVLTTWSTSTLPSMLYVRVPSSGFTGTAYEMAGVQRVRTELVDLNACTEANATQKLNLLKDIIFSGTIPYEGDVLPAAANLGCRLTVTDLNRPTGLQTLALFYTAYSYTFGRRGLNQMSFTTDRAEYTKII